jgi:hypothetical protein
LDGFFLQSNQKEKNSFVDSKNMPLFFFKKKKKQSKILLIVFFSFFLLGVGVGLGTGI